jgi:excisionase family DNA binding protein
MAASTARAVIAWKDDAHIGQFKRFAVSAQYALQADIAELERRADVAELAYQRQVEKLRAEHPDWSGADSTVKAVGGKPPKEPARPGNVQADRKDGSSDNGEPETRGGAEGQQMMTATNIADYINVSADTVRRWIVKGDIAAECLEDGRYGVPKDELDRLRAAQQQKRKRLGKSKEE